MSPKSKKIQPKLNVSKLGFFDRNMSYIASNIPDLILSKAKPFVFFYLTILNSYKMRHKHFYTIFLFFSFLSLTPALAQTVVWDESVDGDLPSNSNDFTTNTIFQSINLVAGVNIIRGTVGNNSGFNGSYLGCDAFSFTVPSGATISAVSVSTYSQSGFGGMGVGSYSGTPLSDITATLVTAPTDILSLFGGGSLAPNQYGLATADSDGIDGSSTYEISITLTPDSSGGDVPTLSEWGLIVLALLLMTLGTLVLVQPNWRGAWNKKD